MAAAFSESGSAAPLAGTVSAACILIFAHPSAVSTTVAGREVPGERLRHIGAG